MSGRTDPLRRLARAHGVMTRYTDAAGEQRDAEDDALRAVLELLGVDARATAAGDALRELTLRRARRSLPPTIVAWEGQALTLTLRTRTDARPPLRLALTLEDGAERMLALTEPALVGRGDERVEGESRVVWRFRVDERLPVGYHRLRFDDDDALLLVAPPRVHPGGPALAERRAWGVFLPVYAIRRAGLDKPMGELDDLAALIDWVAARDGHVVGTLPLLAAMPGNPSPYSPISRLFWNEAFLGMGNQVSGVRPGSRFPDPDTLVDYDAAFARVRARLEAEVAESWSGDEEPQRMRQFRRLRPEVDDYARFRATWEARGEQWRAWPERMRRGELRTGDYDERAYRYHVYAQARMHEQLARLASDTRATGAGLYLDLPLGMHPDGYDVWRFQDQFASDVSVGAPPDPFFTRGQDWGFPPLRPSAMRASRFAYTIATVRNHLRYAGVLRLDHVMGLHRQFWVPNGMDAARGVYVRYPARELYAILAIESHRAQAAIVGENLGTVPENVNVAMQRHAVRGMHVVQFDVAPDKSPMVGAARPGDVSSLNTHDMPTFASFWAGRDLQQRLEWGLLDDEGAAAGQQARRRIRERAAAELRLSVKGDLGGPDAAAAAMRAWLARLAETDAALLLVNLEDLWGELQPQNVPGTTDEMPNWRRRARLTLEELDDHPEVTGIIDAIARLRRKKGKA